MSKKQLECPCGNIAAGKDGAGLYCARCKELENNWKRKEEERAKAQREDDDTPAAKESFWD